MNLLGRLWALFFGKPTPPARTDPRCISIEQFWALQGRFRAKGVWEDVIQDEIRHGELPVYDYPVGTTVAIMDRNGDPQIQTLWGRRLWVPMWPTRYEDEPAYLEELREAMPDADEVRVVSEPVVFINGTLADTRDRGYWAVRLPKDVRPTPTPKHR